MAYQAGFRKPAIIYFNNDWGKIIRLAL
jgi:hypothetical protein